VKRSRLVWLLVVLVLAVPVGVAPARAGGQGDDPSVRILSPSDGAVVPAGTKFRVRMRITPEDFAGHTHVYVDARLRKMVFGESTRLELERGRHTIKVELVDGGHHGLGATDKIVLRARAT
jgi:hypothetical protein